MIGCSGFLGDAIAETCRATPSANWIDVAVVAVILFGTAAIIRSCRRPKR